MNTESANGTVIQKVSEVQLLQALQDLNEENNFLILSDGEEYIQCAWSDGGDLVVEYQDESGHYAADTLQTTESVQGLFSAYLSDGDDWKSMIQWTREEGTTRPEENPAGSGRFADNLKADLSPDKIFGSVKRQVSREISRQVSRKTGGLVSKLIRKVIK